MTPCPGPLFEFWTGISDMVKIHLPKFLELHFLPIITRRFTLELTFAISHCMLTQRHPKLPKIKTKRMCPKTLTLRVTSIIHDWQFKKKRQRGMAKKPAPKPSCLAKWSSASILWRSAMLVVVIGRVRRTSSQLGTGSESMRAH